MRSAAAGFFPLAALFFLLSSPADAAPILSVELTSTSLSTDQDSDGRPDPGDRISYRATVSSTGSSDATSVAVTIPASANLAPVAGTLKSNPIAVNDLFSTDEETPLVIPAPGVLANDFDLPSSAALTVTVPSPSGTVGQMSVGSDGSVTYSHNALAQSLAAGSSVTDSLTYRIDDTDGQSDTATVSVVVHGVNDAPAPVADSYTATGNTTLEVGGTPGNSGAEVYTRAATGLLANDTDPDAGAALQAVAETVATTLGGSATIRTDGTFYYDPPAGVSSGNDTFTYKVTDGTAQVSGAVTVTLSGKLWYIHNNSAGSTSQGTSQNPFASLASFNTANDPAVGSPAANKPQNNDFVYLFHTGINYTGGVKLRNGQTLHGNGEALDRAGVTRNAGTAPVVENSAGIGVALASGNTLRGFHVSNVTGVGISGSNIGTLTVDGTPAMSVTASGGALSLQTGTLAATFQNLTSTGGAIGIQITSCAGNLTVNGTTAVSNATNTGVLLSTNSANISLGTLNITSANTAGLKATDNSGTISTAAGSISTGSGTPVEITRTGGSTPLNVNLTSVSANGAANGILLRNTGGNGFNVLGPGGASSGGVLSNIVGADGATAGCAVYLENVSSFRLSQMHVNNAANFGLKGAFVSNLSMTNVNFTGNLGSNLNTPFDEGAVLLENVSTGNFITNCTFSGSSVEDVVRVSNTGPSGSISFDSCQVTNNTAGANTGIGFFSTGGNLTATVNNTSLNGHKGTALLASASAGGQMTVTLTNNTVVAGAPNQGSRGIEILGAGNANVTYTVTGNNVGTNGVGSVQPLQSTGINVEAQGFSVMSGSVKNNRVTQSSGVSVGSGIRVNLIGAAALTANVANNTVSNVGANHGIHVQSAGLSTSPSGDQGLLKLALTGNSSSMLSTGVHALFVDVANSNRICSRINNNSSTGGGSSTGGKGLLIRQFTNSATFSLEGLASGLQTNGATIISYLQGQNPGVTGSTVSESHVTGIVGVATNNCTGIPF